MDLYVIILWLHVLTGMWIAGSLGVLTICETFARRADTPDTLRALLAVELRTGGGMKAATPVLLLSGLWMAWAHWSITAPWVIEALLLVVYLSITGPLVFGRNMRAATEAATRANAVNQEVFDILHDPVVEVMGRMRYALFTLLVFLMTVKPALPGSLTALVAAVAVGAAAGILQRAPQPGVAKANV